MSLSISESRAEENILRDVWCLLGLPFDSIDMQRTIIQVHAAARDNTPCFISTPNLNFLIESQKDLDFKNTVINSDLNIADGKPIVWMAKFLDIPIPERVAGSNLIEELIENKSGQIPIKVFFFGGEEGIAEKACRKLKKKKSGLECAGYLNPGFGPIEDMSSAKIINEINNAKADFIIVSLGAKKGQAWIEKNRAKFKTPIISHLGAVVNFIGGTVNRSPIIMQKLGLEWLWRIKEEPLLWKRYYKDALSFFVLFITRVLPLFFIVRFANKKKNETAISVISNDSIMKVTLSGCWGKDNEKDINDVFIKLIVTAKDVHMTINKDAFVDGFFMAKLLLLKRELSSKNNKLDINIKSKLVMKIFYYNCCERLVT